MKKILIVSFCMLFAAIVNAQSDSTLQQYVGKYKFPDGSPVSEITITIENGVLTGTSPIGTSEFKRREGDVFDIVAYGGTATFRRNEEKKVTGMNVVVNDINIDGTKENLQLSGIEPRRH